MTIKKKTEVSRAKVRRSSAATPAHSLKREQILQVAEDLFFRHGYAGTTIADIAAKLGVTKPFVYYYFHNKDDLFETLSWQASTASLTSMRFPDDDTRPAIAKLHEGLHRLASANIQYFKAGTFYYRERGALRPAFLRKLRMLARGFHDDLCALLDAARRDGDVQFEDTKLTALAVGSVIGFMYAWYKPNGPVGPAEMANRQTRILLRIVGSGADVAEFQPEKLPAAAEIAPARSKAASVRAA